MIAGPILALNYIVVGKLTHSCLVDLIKVTLAVVDTNLAKVDDGNKVFTAVYCFLYFSLSLWTWLYPSLRMLTFSIIGVLLLFIQFKKTFEGSLWRKNHSNAINVNTHPLTHTIWWQSEKSFRRKINQVQPMWLCMCMGKKLEEAFENPLRIYLITDNYNIIYIQPSRQ